MKRIILASLCPAVFAVGCAEAPMPMGPPQKPAPAPEMAKLERWVGTWSGTAEMVEPSPEEMKAQMPEGEEMPSSFEGGGTYEMVLGGLFLRSEGWHEMGEGEQAHYVEYITWDAKAGKFHNWFFSDYGEIGEGWMTASPDGNTWTFQGSASDASGAKKTGTGKMKMVDDNTIEWEWTESGGPAGKMKLKGTSRRQ